MLPTSSFRLDDMKSDMLRYNETVKYISIPIGSLSSAGASSNECFAATPDVETLEG